MRILVAEDDAYVRQLLKKTLLRAGYDVLEATDGRAALECLLSVDGPRLVLLDRFMPELNGLSLCREIRRCTKHSYVYIIFLTSKGCKEDVLSGLAAGADDCLTKPCNPQELKALLRAGERILKLEDTIVHDALHDPLTRLPNRPFFLDRLSLSVSRGKRHPDYKFAVLFVDIDNFRVVNDSLGNAAGDWLLTQFAERLGRSIRREDAISRSMNAGPTLDRQDGGGILARLGGDRFTILLDDIQDPSDGIRVAERIQRNIQCPFAIDGQEVFITASTGIAFGSTGCSAAENVLSDAFTAMNRAKALGKSRYEVCDPVMHAAAVGRFRLETDLRRALEREEFRAYYQPIVSLGDGRITGFEALMRWQRPKFGLVMPSGFISVTEDTGLILGMGNWVLRKACRQLCVWNKQFPSNRAFTVAVNLSARQFAQPDLVGQIAQILYESGVAPFDLRLELTESVTMEDEERAARIFGELKTLGVRLCLDDFGTGYSSLSYLRRFSLDVLKIDRSFVSDMVSNTESREIVKTILRLGGNLGIEVIAEGVETAEQVSLLQSLGCEYAQGYFFSEPLDQSDVAQTLLLLGASDYSMPQGFPIQAVSPASQ
ncbi:MAG TPA: EAL domain-containing protein [Candidatus Acidoferrales bacterium]|nr:EAL domain-containing protein [Candidatus Acidoferrales bacterium]